MKRILANLLMAATMAAPFVTKLLAQQATEVADIPFSFVVGKRALPAGTYSVEKMFAMQPPIFTMTDKAGRATLLQLGLLEKGDPEHPSLTFACSGGTCVLAKVTPSSGDTAYAMDKNSIDRLLPRHIGVVSMISVKAARR